MTTVQKLDLKKEFKSLYSASREPQLIEVPELSFLMIDGKGAPESPTYQHALQLIYSVAYTAKSIVKTTEKKDYVMPPLEGLWWVDDPKDLEDRSKWNWTLMILQPEFVTTGIIQEAKLTVTRKKKLDIEPLRFERFHEGLAVQILHVGPYNTEVETLAKVHAFISANNLVIHGKHHEIYLSDPRRVSPEKLKTILRQPVIQESQ